jgi:hypothetical protein
MGEGVRSYSITEIKYYHASNPYSPYSNFEDVENLGIWLTAKELYNQIYGVSDRLVFQTCIEANGNPAWGRLFITAEPEKSDSFGYSGVKMGMGINAL